MSLVAVIQQARQAAQEVVDKDREEEDATELGQLRPAQTFKSIAGHRQPDTPSTRTGPPRSLSFAYSLPNTPHLKHSGFPAQDLERVPPHTSAYYGDDDHEFFFSQNTSQSSGDVPGFRTPLEIPSEKSTKDKGKRRESRSATAEDGGWNPLMRWFHDYSESPRDDKALDSDYFGPGSPSTSGTSPPVPSTSIISRIFTQEPRGTNDEQSDDINDIVVRSPTVDGDAQDNGEGSPPSSSLLPEGHLSNRNREKQRGSSYPDPTANGSSSTATPTLTVTSPNSPATRIRRAFSVPQQIFPSISRHSGGAASAAASSADLGEDTKGSEPNPKDKENKTGRAKWARLRSLLPHIAGEATASPLVNAPSSAVSPTVNIIDELITGGLATLMPRLWFERDEKGHRRIPVLLHRLRLRITDSLHPLHKSRSVFRIECEYANGAARWVVYRELRDFVTLHTHYTLAHAVHGASANLRLGGDGKGREGQHIPAREKLPEFPTTSFPYLKFLNKEGSGKTGKAEFAKSQREHLETYLISLIRVVMFHPTSNRLASFLEISALSIALARSGGAQYKAGYLRIEAVSMNTSASSFISSIFSSSKDGEEKGATPFGRKSANWRQRKEQRWCAVRESYLVALEEPGEMTVWDVFLLDSDFRIERPKRYYRQGFGGLLSHDHDSSSDEEGETNARAKAPAPLHPHFNQTDSKEGKDPGIIVKITDSDDTKSAIPDVKSRITKICHTDGPKSDMFDSKKNSKSKVGTGGPSLGLGIGGTGQENNGAGKQQAKEKEESTDGGSQRPLDGNEHSANGATQALKDWKSSSDSDISTSLTRRSSVIPSGNITEHEGIPARVGLRIRSDSDSTLSGARTPMLDPSTNLNPNLLLNLTINDVENAGVHFNGGLDGGALAADDKLKKPDEPNAEGRGTNSPQDGKDKAAIEQAIRAHQLKLKEQQRRAEEKDVSKHTFYIVNSQMRLKLSARNERQMLQFITGLERVAQTSPYTNINRFDSFAPIRLNVAAQWLVDGRDYFWNMSRAILMAKENIYIHDWWLSPELHMRRPGKEHYRLDKLLERKAKEGVKIHIILYLEVSNRTTPTDSNYAKQRLTSLHPNIMVQRSPSHFQTGTFYWAHHEKLCVIDQTIAFMGGLDTCFGRWDTPQHVLTDDTLDTDQPEIWPGKDYSNPRIGDFHTLNRPEEDMYDRTKVPRLPWHDVAMQIVGQPARDLARHFVQRWNYLLRIKNHSKIMPFLLPPPEFRPGELSQMGLTGTCELQIVRSAGPWSMGTPGKVEHSIQNAYLKAIQMSEHFVYIENQFFITSTTVDDAKIENNIGDALVHRIIRAHRDKTPWKCCIMIPLLPGFTFPVDHSDASAIRIIIECQNRTISRGPDSIFSRLRREGIDPDEYISVYSLRNWAKMRGDVLVTEQVYIHAKVCIVDDRLAIIGSANINERSQRGERDSELAAVIRDTDLIDCTMAGKPFKVGRFAHTLRVRLMREHLGIDVDGLEEDDLMTHEPVKPDHEQKPWDPNPEETIGREGGFTHIKRTHGNTSQLVNLTEFVSDGVRQAAYAGAEAMGHQTSKISSKMLRKSETATAGDKELDQERTDYNAKGEKENGFASSVVPTMEEKILLEGRPRPEHVAHGYGLQQEVIEEEGAQDPSLDLKDDDISTSTVKASEIRGSDGILYGAPAGTSNDDGTPRPSADLDNDQQRAAPEARSALRKHLSIKSSPWGVPTTRPKIRPNDFEDPIIDSFWKDKWVASAAHNTEIYRKVFHSVPDDLISTWKQYKDFVAHHERLAKPVPPSDDTSRMPSESEEGSGLGHESQEGTSEDFRDEPSVDANHAPASESKPTRKPTRGTEPFERWEREEMELLLNDLNGHLVMFPTRFLEGEDIANNFLFNADRLLPLPIYA